MQVTAQKANLKGDTAMKQGKVLWTLAITFSGLVMVGLDTLVVPPALPVMRVGLGASREEL